MPAARYVQRQDGEWFGVNRRGHLIACCDCGLVHFVRFRLVGGRLQMQAHRDDKRSESRRRRKDLIARVK